MSFVYLTNKDSSPCDLYKMALDEHLDEVVPFFGLPKARPSQPWLHSVKRLGTYTPWQKCYKKANVTKFLFMFSFLNKGCQNCWCWQTRAKRVNISSFFILFLISFRYLQKPMTAIVIVDSSYFTR